MVFNIIVLVLYILVIAAIAYYSRNKSKTTDQFILAGRGMGGWMSAFAYGTTYFSAVVFVGYAGKFGSSWGLAAVWVGIGNALIGSYLAWKLFAKRTRNITNYLNVNTMPGYFEKRYDNKYLKLISAIIIFVFLLPYSASVYQGIGEIFTIAFKIDFIWCIVIMAVLTALYVFFGGYAGTALTNFVQGIIMAIGVVIMIIVFMTQPQTGFAGLKELSEQGMGLFPQGGGPGLLDAKWFNLIIIILLTSCGVLALPQVIHKYYAAKSGDAVKKATLVATLFALLIGGGAYFMGSLSTRLIDTSSMKPDVIIPTILEKIMPAGLLGLVVVLLLSASMSTLSSMAITGASSVAVDIYKGYVKKEAPDKKVNILLKVLSLVFIVISALLAILKVEAIVAMMSLSWGTLAGCFIGPYIYGLYSKKITSKAAMASLIAGVAVTVILVAVFGIMYPSPDAGGVWAVIKGGVGRSPLIGVVAMAVSMIITPVVSAFTKKPDAGKVGKMFENINTEF
jgi:SSS family solute:Na+ symporter